MIDEYFKKYGLDLSIDDCRSEEDSDWNYYTNEDYSITVDETINYHDANEYVATVWVNDKDYIEKEFIQGEEEKLIEFITTDKLKLLEERTLDQIKKDFD